GQFWNGQARIEGDEDRPQGATGEEALQQGRVVGAQVGDPVTAAHPQFTQDRGQAQDTFVQFGVGVASAFVDHCHTFGGGAGAAGRPGTDALVTHVYASFGRSRPSRRAALSLRILGRTSGLMSSWSKAASQRSGVSTG